MKLFFNALTKFLCGIILTFLLIFLPAGTLDFARGWLFVCILFVPILIMGIVLFIKSPELLKKRLDSKEKELTQKGVVAASGLCFLLGFISAGLDHRFGWSYVPVWLTAATSVLFLVGYGLYAEVLRENAYLSRTVKVFEGQKVVQTGLYGIVRHPMYMATLLIFLSIPLILGSWVSLIFFLHYPVIIILRIKNEESVLEKELNGYSEYKNKVKYRIIPFIW